METENVQEKQAPEKQAPESAVDISPEKDGGVLKEILQAGEGDSSPSPGDTVFVHYDGTLTNGEKFDSSRDRGEKFEFQLDKGKVIKAWDIGVATMKRGEKARLWCKPEYAYGESGSPPKIPPNATLIFEVELFDWKGEDITEARDGGIIKHDIKKGEGYKTPNDGATVKMRYVGRYNGNTFEDREVEFEVGDGPEHGLIEGLELIIKNLKQGEKAKFEVSPQYAYGSKGKEDFNIPPDATLEYEVEMLNFEKAKEGWEMNTKEKLEQSEMAKSKGTSFFKEENYKKAMVFYKKIISFLEYETSLEPDNQKLRDSLMLAAHLNLSMCHLKMGDCFSAVQECDKALEMDTTSTKAYFRRGQAHYQMRDFETARVDFQEVLKLEPENKAAKNQLTLCNQKIKQFNDKQKKIYAGMFTKFAEQDAKKIQKVDDTKEVSEEKAPTEETNNTDGPIAENNDTETGSGDATGEVAMET